MRHGTPVAVLASCFQHYVEWGNACRQFGTIRIGGDAVAAGPDQRFRPVEDDHAALETTGRRRGRESGPEPQALFVLVPDGAVRQVAGRGDGSREVGGQSPGGAFDQVTANAGGIAAPRRFDAPHPPGRDTGRHPPIRRQHRQQQGCGPSASGPERNGQCREDRQDRHQGGGGRFPPDEDRGGTERQELPVTNAPEGQGPLSLKHLPPDVVRDTLARDPRLLVPVGTTEQHGPHLPLGADTLLVERLADDLSAAFQVLRAPTLEYGVNRAARIQYPGNASVRRKTLHRFMNDLIGSWEAGGVREFIILTAHGWDPHQEALSTLRTRDARVRTVDVFSVPLPGRDHLPIHGGEVDTSLLLYVDGDLVNLAAAEDFVPSGRGRRGRLPGEGPGSVGLPSRASVETGRRLYHLIYERIAERVLGRPNVHGA